MDLRNPGLALLALLAALSGVAEASGRPGVAATEQAFLDYLDAEGAVAYVESGKVDQFEGRDLAAWQRLSLKGRKRLAADLARAGSARLPDADARALAAMRRTLDSQEADSTTAGVRKQACRDAERRDLDLPSMRAALVSCWVEIGNKLAFEGRAVDRSTALQLLHVVDDPARRKAIFDAFLPVWTALNGHDESDSPYRRMIGLAAKDAAQRGSAIDAAAGAIGVQTVDVERWLTQILEAWAESSGPAMVEPWDYRYSNSEANRRLVAAIPPESLLAVSERFYREVGADLSRLGVLFDLAPRPNKSALAYTDFVKRGRTVSGTWQRSVARVVGTYPTGGLYSMNELVHENGHAVHIAAIHNRPAYMDWPDSLFTEAFADVPSWSVHEPAWQQRYLGVEVPEAVSLRALFSDVMLDVAWSLFELRMLRDPQSDPNLVWTDITSRYLHVVPHPEVPWWLVRVQLVGSPGYMVNYGLGAVLTAEMRARTIAEIGSFDAGNPAWYGWVSEHLLQYGSERDAQSLLRSYLGRPLSPEALLEQIRRCRRP